MGNLRLNWEKLEFLKKDKYELIFSSFHYLRSFHSFRKFIRIQKDFIDAKVRITVFIILIFYSECRAYC